MSITWLASPATMGCVRVRCNTLSGTGSSKPASKDSRPPQASLTAATFGSLNATVPFVLVTNPPCACTTSLTNRRTSTPVPIARRVASHSSATASTLMVRWANMPRDFFSFTETFSHSACIFRVSAESSMNSNAIWRVSACRPRSSRPCISACTTSPVLAGTGTEMPSEERIALCLRSSTSSTIPSI